MTDPKSLSRRGRQIMEIVYSCGEATVAMVEEQLEDAPTRMAIRRTMHILEEKGHLTRRAAGREVMYRPKRSRKRAGKTALENVLKTFFSGSLEDAVAAHLVGRKQPLSKSEKLRLMELIKAAKEEESS